jgi:general secretion pathway protein D
MVPFSYYPELLKPPMPDDDSPSDLQAKAPTAPQPTTVSRAVQLNGRTRELTHSPVIARRDGRVLLLSNRPANPELVELNFDNADIQSVIRAIAELTEINYIIHPAVKGTVTIQTAGKIPVEGLLPTLEQILTVNNLTMVKVGNLYRVVPVAQARQMPLAAQLGSSSRAIPEEDRFVIQIVPLKFISTAVMQESVKPLLSPQSAMIPVRNTNNLIIVDTASNVKKVLRVVELLDTNAFDRYHTKLYPLEYADPETLATELTNMFTSLGYGAKPGPPLEFIPIPRLNSLLVISGLPDLTPSIELWTTQLDQPVQRGEEQTFVYYVQHGSAENIATILQSLFKPSGELPARAPSPAGDVEPGRRKIIPPKVEERPAPAAGSATTAQSVGGVGLAGELALFVVPDAESNSLIFRTKPVHHQNVLAVIKKLDRKPKQVIIEALIAEVNLTGDFALGLEYAFSQVDSAHGGVKTTGQLGNVLAAPSSIPLATDAAAAATTGGLSLFLTNPERFLATLDAFARDNNLNIVSSPSILTSENKPAEISVVTEVPISRTTTDPNTQTTRTDFEFREVGVKLKITPKINENRFVTLDIEEELSEIGARTEGEDAPPNFNSREAKTSVVVKDNTSLIIGGLIAERVNEVQTGIPFLNRIPLLKHIFGRTVIEKNRTELVVMLTPRIVFDETDARALSDLYNERMGNIKELFKHKKIGHP